MATKCDFCAEEIDGEPVRRGLSAYCSEACAFEAQRSAGCDDRTDSAMTSSTVEPAEKREE